VVKAGRKRTVDNEALKAGYTWKEIEKLAQKKEMAGSFHGPMLHRE